MATVVRDLMSAPAVTCDPETTLTDAARQMSEAEIGSVIVVRSTKVAGILTERDLLRASAAGCSPDTEPVHLWMTANPDALSPEEEASAAWASLSHHHYRHLPVVDGDELVGVVSLRDLFGVALLRPADEHRVEVPAGLEGVVVAETTIGDVRGLEGFYHYRQYSAVDLAATRSLEDVWYLLFEGHLPDREESRAFAARIAPRRHLPPGLVSLLPQLATAGTPLEVLRTAVSVLGAELGWRPTLDVTPEELRPTTCGC
jgi:CBS domain-containing protein